MLEQEICMSIAQKGCTEMRQNTMHYRSLELIFSEKGFLPVWLAGLFIIITETALAITITWTTWESSGSATGVGLMIAMLSLPKLILETFIGEIVDISNRRRLMLIGCFGTLLVAIILSLFSVAGFMHRGLLTFLVIWFLPVCSMLFYRARSSLLPRLFPDATKLLQVNSILRTTSEGAAFLGGGVALLISFLGASRVMFCAIVFALLATLFAGLVPNCDADRKLVRVRLPSRKTQLGSLGELLQNRFLVWYVATIALSNVPHKAINAMLIPLASSRFEAGALGYGLLELALSLGAISSYLLSGALFAKRCPYRMTILGLAWSAVAVTLVPLSRNYVVIILLVTYGFSEGFFLPADTRYSLTINDSSRGRTNALFNSIALVLSPIAQVGAGFVVDKFGVSALYTFSGFLLIVIAIAAWAFKPRLKELPLT